MTQIGSRKSPHGTRRPLRRARYRISRAERWRFAECVDRARDVDRLGPTVAASPSSVVVQQGCGCLRRIAGERAARDKREDPACMCAGAPRRERCGWALVVDAAAVAMEVIRHGHATERAYDWPVIRSHTAPAVAADV